MGGTSIKYQYDRFFVEGCYTVVKMVNILKKDIGIHKSPWGNSNCADFDETFVSSPPYLVYI